MADMNTIADRLADITAQLDKRVKLIAVSKRQPEPRVEAALKAGHRIFGENQLQEAQARWQGRRSTCPDLELHMLGPLQSNKVKEAVALFDAIHSLDREKIARKLASEIRNQGRDPALFIQVNTGEETQKSGVLPKDLEAFYAFCTKECDLTITGLMCIPPLSEPPALHFALLKRLAGRLGLDDVSMGMSSDYKKALDLGSTYIRVGSEIFGAREEG